MRRLSIAALAPSLCAPLLALGCTPEFSSPIDDDVGAASYCGSVSTWESAWSELELELADAVNAARGAERMCGGIDVGNSRGLEFVPELRCAARRRARHAGDNNTLSPTDFDGNDPLERAYRAEYEGIPRGEVLAHGYRNAQQVVDAFLGSAEHCEVVMDRNFDDIGTGVYDFGPEPIWVVAFGRQR